MGSVIQDIIREYRLVPLEGEGGFYRRTLTCERKIETASLGSFTSSHLQIASHIYYLATEESFSLLHRIQSLEIWTWMKGDPARMITIDQHRNVQSMILGREGPFTGTTLVDGGVWQGTRPLEGGEFGYSLFSIAVIPSFDPADFILADAAILSGLEKGQREEILPLIAGGER